jgi:hypothetical protein
VNPDLTGQDPLAFYLAYLHPLWMLGSLGLALATLRAGLRLRRARRLGHPRSAAAYRRHLRLAKPTLLCVAIGFAAGIASSVLLRGWDALSTAHGAVAVAALAVFLATGTLGWRLERASAARSEPTRGFASGEANEVTTARSRAVEWHARLAALAVLLAAAAIGTGFVLLP